MPHLRGGRGAGGLHTHGRGESPDWNVGVEIDKALALGYRMVTKYAAWHFKETMRYEDGVGGLWGEYIDLWLKLKQEASGYPSWCTTEELKKWYMADYQRHEGICLSPARIVKNEGLCSLCKIMLNSHWGTFGQNPNKSKVTYISDPAEYVEMMTDDTLEVTDLMYANQEHVVIRWHTKGEFLDSPSNTNIVLTAYSTAQAWLKLYTLLDGLQERVLYFDTDSVVYVHDETWWNPELGDYLGELKDETKGVGITHFVLGGAKNYTYQLEDGQQVCKIRGFTLNHRSAALLKFYSMKELVTTPEKRDEVITIQEPHKIVHKGGHIYSVEQTKEYRVIYNKQRLLDDLTTLPFGWKPLPGGGGGGQGT